MNLLRYTEVCKRIKIYLGFRCGPSFLRRCLKRGSHQGHVPRMKINWTMIQLTRHSKVDFHLAGPCQDKELLFASSPLDLDRAR